MLNHLLYLVLKIFLMNLFFFLNENILDALLHEQEQQVMKHNQVIALKVQMIQLIYVVMPFLILLMEQICKFQLVSQMHVQEII